MDRRTNAAGSTGRSAECKTIEKRVPIIRRRGGGGSRVEEEARSVGFVVGTGSNDGHQRPL